MKFRLAHFLICPRCGGALHITVTQERVLGCPMQEPAQKCSACALGMHDPASREHCLDCSIREITSGSLTCFCGGRYPIVDGVPVLLPQEYRYDKSGDIHKQSRKTSQRFGYEWMRYPACFHKEERNIFFEESQLDPGELKGKLILDAGCGMGRFTRVAGSCGGEVIGVDLSESVHRAHAVTEHLPYVHIVQGDLLRLAFRDASFDIIYSLGVLHHTPDTAGTFSALVQKLRDGGIFTGWVYGTAGEYSKFKTNPLRPDRARFVRFELVKKLYWLMVLLRENCSNALRRVTVPMPHKVLYALCHVLAALGKVPALKYLTFSVHPDWRVRLLENFDWLAPPFQYHHTKEEMLAFFEHEAVSAQQMLQHGFIPKVGIRGVKKHR